MNDLCSPYKKRKLPVILRSVPLFSKAIHNRDVETASRIVFLTTMEVLGVKGLIKALDRASQLYERRQRLVQWHNNELK